MTPVQLAYCAGVVTGLLVAVAASSLYLAVRWRPRKTPLPPRPARQAIRPPPPDETPPSVALPAADPASIEFPSKRYWPTDAATLPQLPPPGLPAARTKQLTQDDLEAVRGDLDRAISTFPKATAVPAEFRGKDPK